MNIEGITLSLNYTVTEFSFSSTHVNTLAANISELDFEN